MSKGKKRGTGAALVLGKTLKMDVGTDKRTMGWKKAEK